MSETFIVAIVVGSVGIFGIIMSSLQAVKGTKLKCIAVLAETGHQAASVDLARYFGISNQEIEDYYRAERWEPFQ